MRPAELAAEQSRPAAKDLHIGIVHLHKPIPTLSRAPSTATRPKLQMSAHAKVQNHETLQFEIPDPEGSALSLGFGCTGFGAHTRTMARHVVRSLLSETELMGMICRETSTEINNCINASIFHPPLR